ncbi:YvpB like protein [Liquorilactobacillus aquaticus DSM 21051]|uniref:YvpB like protein n=2 Tax=Liquorilactobacillus aquaticus TaxID=392566 RepID=A0A0R2CV54_9LACO|nr:C39 family peptidase [Liquorilactobacillus aquaticus]KRM95285.1 YvpB like protein [Liquorilactobacillus aquaticus DSM 21051]
MKKHQKGMLGPVLVIIVLVGAGTYIGGLTLTGNLQKLPFVSDIDSSIDGSSSNETKEPKKVNFVKLDVPLLNQLDDPTLYNGCEVTSLAMLLNYYGVDVTKNELGEKIKTVPMDYDNGQHGNPNVGFVGDVTGADPGLGVYHGPITDLAKKYSDKVRDITGQSFDNVIQELEKGHPVWTITTASFAAVDDFQDWDTPQGKIKITFSEHSVVITGFDRKNNLIYINNPYGKKNQAVSWSDFEEAYDQMGKQAVYINTDK